MRKGFRVVCLCVFLPHRVFSRARHVKLTMETKEKTESLRAHYTIVYIVYIYVYNIIYIIMFHNYVITCAGTFSSLDTSSKYDKYLRHTALDDFLFYFFFCFIMLLKKPLSPFCFIFVHHHLRVIISWYNYSCFPE